MIAMLAVVSLLTAQTPDSIRIERLATLGRLWYAARLFHPYLAYRTIDWDSALVATIPRVSAARTADEYAAAVQGMLDALGDPATHIARPQTAGQPNAREPDPRARWTADSVLVISATNYADLDDWNRGIARCDSFAQLVPHARAVVFDLRQRVPGASSGFVSFVFSQSKLLPQLFAGPPLAAPGQRSRMHSGYRGDVTGNSGSGYWSAWVTQDGDVFSGPPGTMSRPIAFVVSDRSEVPGAALALQAGGRAALVVEGTATDESLVGTTELEIGDGLKVRLRLSELVFADGTGGLPADTVVGTPAAAATDPSLEAALVMVRRPVATHHPRSPLEPRSAPPPQRDYAGMTYPSLPYRLLAAFRIWGTFEYFHAYKQLYDEDWTGVLKTFIPRLEGAQDSLEYALTLAEMVSHTRDNHVRVNSPVLAAYWGEAQTPLLVRIIQGVPVVTGFTNDSVARAAGVRIGDVIERVDGEAVATRLARRERYLTASTPQWLHWAAVRSLLAGPEGSTAVLRLRGATGGAEKAPSHEVRLPRHTSRAATAAARDRFSGCCLATSATPISTGCPCRVSIACSSYFAGRGRSSSICVVILRARRGRSIFVGAVSLAPAEREGEPRCSQGSARRTTQPIGDPDVASMKSDLRNLVTAEEAYFADSVKYTSNLGRTFYTTTGVTGPTITLTADGWKGWVGSRHTTKTCAIFVGSSPLPPAVVEGMPACQEGPPLPVKIPGRK